LFSDHLIQLYGPSNLELGGKIEVGCNQGFSPITKTTLECKEDGNWEGVVPQCTGRYL